MLHNILGQFWKLRELFLHLDFCCHIPSLKKLCEKLQYLKFILYWIKHFWWSWRLSSGRLCNWWNFWLLTDEPKKFFFLCLHFFETWRMRFLKYTVHLKKKTHKTGVDTLFLNTKLKTITNFFCIWRFYDQQGLSRHDTVMLSQVSISQISFTNLSKILSSLFPQHLFVGSNYNTVSSILLMYLLLEDFVDAGLCYYSHLLFWKWKETKRKCDSTPLVK